MTRAEAWVAYHKDLSEAAADSPATLKTVTRAMAQTDLFFLLVSVLRRVDADNDFVYKQCLEVQARPDGYIDLWAREHYKSSIITFALTIQEILNNPEITIGIFSHTRPKAKDFLRQIKTEFETNKELCALFPEIFWSDCKLSSPKWSEDDGIVVKRRGNPAASTVEAWGVVDGQPTGKHYDLLIYDDVVTRESVTTPEMIQKTNDALALSYNLGSQGGRRRFVGTFYHLNDTWHEVIKRGVAIPRIIPATDREGNPVFLSREALAQKRRDMGQYVYSCQLMLDPVAESVQGFNMLWLKRWVPANFIGMNLYIVVDPANAKKKKSDYTSLWVIGLGSDKNYYVIDGLRDRLNLVERTKALMDMHRKYRPVRVGYEQYGKDSDIQHIEYVQQAENYRFEVVPLGGQVSKFDRISRLIPLFEAGRVYIPWTLRRRDYEKKEVDVVQQFILEEYSAFPVAGHDDMLDCLARILEPDLMAAFPKVSGSSSYRPPTNPMAA